jgi:hypothetical protein
MANDFVNPQTTILGGQNGLVQSGPAANGSITSNEQGVYANYPAAQLKYDNSNDAGSVASQARLFINLAGNSTTLYSQLYNAIKSPSAQAMLSALVGSDNGLGSNTGGTGYVDFLLGQADERLDERYQISEVLSDSYITYCYGQHAPIWSFSGYLLNTKQDSWSDAWDILYNSILRGSQLANIQQLVRLRYDNKVVSGIIINSQKSIRAELQMCYNFSFQMIVSQIDVTIQPTWVPTTLNNPFSSGLSGLSVISPPQLVPMTYSAAVSPPPRLTPNAAQNMNPPPTEDVGAQLQGDFTYSLTASPTAGTL